MNKYLTVPDSLLRFSIHLAAAIFAVSTLGPLALKAHPRLTQDLWSGRDQSYVAPGSHFKIFKPYLAAQGRYSLILDRPNNESVKYKEASYDAQNFLAPLVINLETVEPMALVYCSTPEIAEQRLAQTGYEWAYPLAPGKGLAKKQNS